MQRVSISSVVTEKLEKKAGTSFYSSGVLMEQIICRGGEHTISHSVLVILATICLI